MCFETFPEIEKSRIILNLYGSFFRVLVRYIVVRDQIAHSNGVWAN